MQTKLKKSHNTELCVSFITLPYSHPPPLISRFLHVSWWVLSESCQGICVCPPSSPHYSPWGAPAPSSPPRVSLSAAPMCSAASWRISPATVVTADDAPSSPASCCLSWWTTRRMLDCRVWYSELGEWEDGGEGDMDGCRGSSDDCESRAWIQFPMDCEGWNKHSISLLPAYMQTSEQEAHCLIYSCMPQCAHTVISVPLMKQLHVILFQVSGINISHSSWN